MKISNNCIFCNIPGEKILHTSKHFHLIEDKYPVSNGHLLIISKEHRTNYFDLTKEELTDLDEMIMKSKNLIEKKFMPDGYNIGMNCGKPAGQTIFHFHCHIIPRYEGDMDNPAGGVRHCVAGKGHYLKNYLK